MDRISILLHRRILVSSGDNLRIRLPLSMSTLGESFGNPLELVDLHDRSIYEIQMQALIVFQRLLILVVVFGTQPFFRGCLQFYLQCHEIQYVWLMILKGQPHEFVHAQSLVFSLLEDTPQGNPQKANVDFQVHTDFSKA